LSAAGDIDQILPVPYDKIHGQTMTPVAHLCWSAAWSGIAAAAVRRAQIFTRKAARQNGGQLPPGAPHYTRAQSQLRTLRALLQTSLAHYQRALENEAMLASIDFQTGMTLLKVDASELAVATVLSAMRSCGLSGYRNDGEASIGRHLRDVLSSPLMINNDRILSNLSTAALISIVPDGLTV
jgi:acyl-CoA dehydrogenase